jgi:hypothetical protein
MSSNRREDLQRKLALHEVPHPPADLLEKIKADIPQHLRAAPVPVPRFGGPLWQIAASVLLLAASGAIAVFVTTPHAEKNLSAIPARPKPAPVIQRAAPQEAANSVTVAVEPSRPAAVLRPAPSRNVPAPAEEPQTAYAIETDATAVLDHGITGGAVAADVRTEAEAPAQAESISVTAAAPMIAREEAAVAAVAPAAAPAPPPPALAPQAEHVTASRSAAQKMNAALAQSVPSTIFGMSVDRDAFDRVRSTIEAGARPAASAVDVEALVNYFAGPASRPPDHGLRLEVETSPQPTASEGNRAVLRFTVDAARLDLPAGTPVTAVARDVHVAISIDSRAVPSFHRLGGSDAISDEPALLGGASATAIYELDLARYIAPNQLVARVRLTWISTEDGRSNSTEKRILGRDLVRTWKDASQRHRLATLGAVWGESLKSNAGASEVARRAAELAAESPDDDRARQLATLSSAASRIGGASSAGSR